MKSSIWLSNQSSENLKKRGEKILISIFPQNILVVTPSMQQKIAKPCSRCAYFLRQYAESSFFQHVWDTTLTILHIKGQNYPNDDTD